MKLSGLLTTAQQELLLLLNYLEEQGGHAKKKQLCEALGISLKTLRLLLQTIQSQYSQDITLVNHSREIFLTYTDFMSFTLFKNSLIKASVTHQILLYLLTEQNPNSQELQERFFISESGVKRHLKKLKALLLNWNLTLRGLKIIGTEEEIRSFFLLYLCEVYTLSEEPFSGNQQVEALFSAMITLFNQDDSKNITEFNKYRLRRLLYISYYRSFHGKKSWHQQMISQLSLSYPLTALKQLPNSEDFPKTLLSQSELELLAHFFYHLPLLTYDGPLFKKFFQREAQQETMAYKVYQYTHELLLPAFQYIDNPTHLQSLQLLLFSTNLNALFFFDELGVTEVIGNRVTDINLELSQPSIEYVIELVTKLNTYLEILQIAPVHVNYLVDHYGFLIIQSSLYSSQKIRVGCF